MKIEMKKELEDLIITKIIQGVCIKSLLETIEGMEISYYYSQEEKNIYIFPYTTAMLYTFLDSGKLEKPSDDTGEFQTAKKLLEMSAEELKNLKKAIKIKFLEAFKKI